jgi:membrane-associated protein
MFNIVSFIQAAGYLGITAVVFAESGLFVGFFLPGDSLLFTAGILASQGYLNITLLVLLTFVGAVLGDSVGYAFGKKVGPHIFKKEGSFWFNPMHVEQAQKFFDTHGNKAIILARFMPVVRTFTPILAGVGKMQYKNFIAYNVVGGALWAAGLPLLGYYLGSVVPNIDKYLIPIIILIIIVSFIPVVMHIVREKKGNLNDK